jgi:hypothetical protein
MEVFPGRQFAERYAPSEQFRLVERERDVEVNAVVD